MKQRIYDRFSGRCAYCGKRLSIESMTRNHFIPRNAPHGTNFVKEEELKTVKVSDIREYPTALGTRCQVFRYYGLDAYHNSEEELMGALIKSSEDVNNIEICKKSSRCAAFYDLYQKGETPYNEKDKIRLLEYKGKYWAEEGKHRVCMAKRLNIETVDAYIWKIYEDISILPPIGEAGTFAADYFFDIRFPRLWHGDILGLWINTPYGAPPSRFDFNPVFIDSFLNTKGKQVNVFNGLSYTVTVNEIAYGFFQRKKYIHINVCVCVKKNENSKIWLFKTKRSKHTKTLQTHQKPISLYETLYRRGCWRVYDLKRGVWAKGGKTHV